MSMTCISRAETERSWVPPKDRTFTKQFMLGVAIAGLIWTALAVGTTISVGSSVVSESPRLVLSQ
jgi:hypothetical protein